MANKKGFNFDKEMANIMKYITNILVKKYPCKIIGIEYYYLAILEREESLTRKFLKNYYTDKGLEDITKDVRDSIKEKVEELSEDEANKPKFSTIFDDVIKNIKKEKIKEIDFFMSCMDTKNSLFEIYFSEFIYNELERDFEPKIRKDKYERYLIENRLEKKKPFYCSEDFFKEIVNVLQYKRSNNVIIHGEDFTGKTTMSLSFRDKLEKLDINNKEFKNIKILYFQGEEFDEFIEKNKEFIKTKENFIIIIDDFNKSRYSYFSKIKSTFENIFSKVNLKFVLFVNTSFIRGENIIEEAVGRKSKYITEFDLNEEMSNCFDKYLPDYLKDNYSKYKFSEDFCKKVSSLLKLEKDFYSYYELIDDVIDVIITREVLIERNSKLKDLIITPSLFEKYYEGTIVKNKDVEDIIKVLKEKIVGQDKALETINLILYKKELNLLNKNKPIVLYFNGTTGTGKTYLAKKLAEELYGSEDKLLKYNMSEYVLEHSVSKLFGAEPGYIGYERGGILTNAVIKAKSGIILLDEFEKAHKSIYNTFLQVFDEGELVDNSGKRADFKDFIIIITSNLGAKEYHNKTNLGYADCNDIQKTREDFFTKVMFNHFSPEFLNRIDDVVFFNNLTEEDLKNIISKELKIIENRLSELNVTFEKDFYSKDFIDKIFNLTKKDKFKQGGRLIKHTLEKNVLDKIINFMIKNKVKENYIIKLKDIE